MRNLLYAILAIILTGCSNDDDFTQSTEVRNLELSINQVNDNFPIETQDSNSPYQNYNYYSIDLQNLVNQDIPISIEFLTNDLDQSYNDFDVLLLQAAKDGQSIDINNPPFTLQLNNSNFLINHPVHPSIGQLVEDTFNNFNFNFLESGQYRFLITYNTETFKDNNSLRLISRALTEVTFTIL